MSLRETACEEALLERVEENNHGWTILKLMRLLEDREKGNIEKVC
jgi:hypothetical protein